MKKILNLWLLAALLCGLGLSVTSCKDDDDDSKSEEQQQEQEQQASKFWSVVGQLVSSDDYTADYADKTFEPVYGTADATNATTRIVEVNDMATAANYFADLITVDDGSPATIDENTQTYTYSDPDVGTLTYTRGGTASEWATVDVSIKQLPSLRKIVYRQGGEGTNTAFAGKAWYRFGDVVSRTLENGRTEYWICVRPAFGPESTSSSFWVCLNYLPAKNTFKYEYQGKSWVVPTGIGTDKKNMQNLAEMLYAIIHPDTWYENATNYHTDGKYWGYSGMPIFNDWKKTNVMYHNQYFWQKVGDAWLKHQIAENAMNLELAKLAECIDRDGINLLYKGYSWWTKTSWNCTLYEASFTNGAKNDQKNLHHAEYKDLTKRMQDIKFDCTTMGARVSNYTEFFGDKKYRWVIRFATGEELNGGTKPAPTAQLQGGCRDVYRYYAEYPEEWEKPGPNGDNGPEVTAQSYNDPAKWNKTNYLGASHYRTGYIYKDEQGHRWICVGQSGLIGEESPYAEFVSFDGLTPSADKRCITNLPTRDQAIRGAFWLNMIFSMSSDRSFNDEFTEGWFSNQRDYAHVVLNCREWVGFDPSTFFQRIKAQNNDTRQDTQAASIAYNDNSGHQRLLRWVMNNQNNLQEFIWYLADNYVKNPDPNEQKYGEAAYGTTPIYLEDLTSRDTIAVMGIDTYAKQPLSKKDAKNNDGSEAARSYRTDIDPDATDATKFLYNMAKWNTRSFKTDMWNAPILMFRYTRAYDRGDGEYSTRTTDGHTLTLYKKFRWLLVVDLDKSPEEQAEEDVENYNVFVSGTLRTQTNTAYSEKAWHLNGKAITFPKWNTIGD